jgi:uncharacterized protein (DUF58 family)
MGQLVRDLSQSCVLVAVVHAHLLLMAAAQQGRELVLAGLAVAGLLLVRVRLPLSPPALPARRPPPHARPAPSERVVSVYIKKEDITT